MIGYISVLFKFCVYVYSFPAYLMLLTVLLVDFPSVGCEAVLNAFVGVKALYLVVNHHCYSWRFCEV
jgi:hypothetical protein